MCQFFRIQYSSGINEIPYSMSFIDLLCRMNGVTARTEEDVKTRQVRYYMLITAEPYTLVEVELRKLQHCRIRDV